MSTTALKALVVLVPALVLLAGSALLLYRTRSAASLLQLLGSVCLVVVVLTHLCEAFGLFPWMGWGLADSVGHYLALGSAVLGFTLFPIGYLWHALKWRRQ
jgi:predicted Na+-dependent transporter